MESHCCFHGSTKNLSIKHGFFSVSNMVTTNQQTWWDHGVPQWMFSRHPNGIYLEDLFCFSRGHVYCTLYTLGIIIIHELETLSINLHLSILSGIRWFYHHDRINRTKRILKIWKTHSYVYAYNIQDQRLHWISFTTRVIAPFDVVLPCSSIDPPSKGCSQVMARVNPKMEMAQNEGKAQQIQKIEAEFNEGAPCFLFLQSTFDKQQTYGQARNSS